MNNQYKIIIDGCSALKNKHCYKEAYFELEKIKLALSEEYLNDLLHLQAQCIYQDKEINSKYRFEKALKLLDESNDEQEKSRLKGAVYKRKYQLYKKEDDLELAIDFYSKAAKNVEEDKGYGAVNAIYLYFELQKRTKKLHLHSLYSRKINELRKDALEYLTKNKFDNMKWINPTLAELYFSFNEKEKYDLVKKYLVFDNEHDSDNEKLKKLSQIKSIEIKTQEAINKALKIKTIFSRDNLITIEQLIRLYKLQNENISDENSKILVGLFTHNMTNENHIKAVESIVTNVLVGKVGLALSGGGFRASLFHIGVFSRLAELDMLKHIDVISSVSGGSIMAMHYYLKLQQLLERKDNYKIEQKDYVKLVKDMQEEFLKGVQKNIRMQAFKQYNPCDETVTQRIGKLYQTELYDKAVNGCAPRTMNKLYIHPKVNNHNIKSFNPHFNNIEISSKIPILVINSTCLNNGHNWRFTASGMGESQYMYDTTIDKNTIHKYTRYDDFTEEFKNFTIAEAVASSSCVPGLFDPIELNEAYQKDENIKLIDGGVYDNQGLASLIDEECDLIICSDASGQFNDDNDPSSCRLSVIPRINDALMDRGRDQEYEIVKEMKDDKKIDGLCIVHLKQCFEVKEIPENKHKDAPHGKCADADIYKEIDVKIQESLSKVRTDLDSFNDMEAYSLMYSGYTIMSKWFETIKKEQSVWKKFKANQNEKWKFLKIKEVMDNDEDRLLEQLEDSQKLFMKINPFKTCLPCVIVFVIGIILSAYFVLTNLEIVGFLVVAMLILYKVKIKWLYKFIKYGTKPIVWIVARYNFSCLNEKYLEKGKL